MKLEVQTRHQDTRKIDAYAIFRRYSWKPECRNVAGWRVRRWYQCVVLARFNLAVQCWCRVLAVGSKAGGAEVESDGGQVVGDHATAQREGRN